MTDQGRSDNASDSEEFEVLMEFQRQVKDRFDRGRILWFNNAVSALAQHQNTTANEVMQKALTDFEQFVKQVEKNVGPVPSGEQVPDPGSDSDGDGIEGFDQLLINE